MFIGLTSQVIGDILQHSLLTGMELQTSHRVTGIDFWVKGSKPVWSGADPTGEFPSFHCMIHSKKKML